MSSRRPIFGRICQLQNSSPHYFKMSSIKVEIEIPRPGTAPAVCTATVTLAAIGAETDDELENQRRVASYTAQMMSQTLAAVETNAPAPAPTAAPAPAAASLKRKRNEEVKPLQDAALTESRSTPITVLLINSQSQTFPILTKPNATIDSLKDAYEEKTGIPPTASRLIFAGKQMDAMRTLAQVCTCLSFALRQMANSRQYNIIDGSTIHVTLVLRGS